MKRETGFSFFFFSRDGFEVVFNDFRLIVLTFRCFLLFTLILFIYLSFICHIFVYALIYFIIAFIHSVIFCCLFTKLSLNTSLSIHLIVVYWLFHGRKGALFYGGRKIYCL